MATKKAFEKSGLKVIDGNSHMWKVEYNGKQFFIAEVDGRVDWTPRYHVTDLQTREKICTRANYTTAIQLIKQA